MWDEYEYDLNMGTFTPQNRHLWVLTNFWSGFSKFKKWEWWGKPLLSRSRVKTKNENFRSPGGIKVGSDFFWSRLEKSQLQKSIFFRDFFCWKIEKPFDLAKSGKKFEKILLKKSFQISTKISNFWSGFHLDFLSTKFFRLKAKLFAEV